MLWFACLPALAHIALEEPPPRYPSDGNTNNKACPCGVGESNRYCNVASDRSDPDRDDSRASTFVAGQTITVRFDETIGHAGRYRIAFDPDGADMEDFNANILLDVPDTAGNTGNAGGITWEFQVTLPDTPCDNCTLQLVQMMDGNTTDPVPDPVGRSSYYQCADLVLVAGEIPTPPAPGADTDPPPLDTDTAQAACGCRAAPAPALTLPLLLAVLGLRRRRS